MYAEAGLDAAGILKTVKDALPERKAGQSGRLRLA
jgi:1-deoxy-D-xylulose-5-phosphate synthase